MVRAHGGKDWQPVESADYVGEVELHKLVAESPSLVPVEDIRPGASRLVVAVTEFGLPGSGNTDILAFSPGGEIAIVECKLASNRQIKREVIGQILEYGAYLWETTYEKH
jgi:hypothetical protein